MSRSAAERSVRFHHLHFDWKVIRKSVLVRGFVRAYASECDWSRIVTGFSHLRQRSDFGGTQHSADRQVWSQHVAINQKLIQEIRRVVEVEASFSAARSFPHHVEQQRSRTCILHFSPLLNTERVIG